MSKEISKNEIEDTLNLLHEFKTILRTNNKSLEDVNTRYHFLNDFYVLYDQLFTFDVVINGVSEYQLRACREAAVYLLPEVEKMLQKKLVVSDDLLLQDVYHLYRKTYSFIARRSLEHFIDFMEWERTSHRKVYFNRKEVLKPFVYYLNKMTFDEKIKYVIASYPPSYGKTFVMNYFSAWLFGVNYDSSILRLSYGEELVFSSSRSIRELVQSSLFSEVFPNFKIHNGKPFNKEKDSDWKLRGSDVLVSHYARTREGAVTGVRANAVIILDDMTKGVSESTNVSLHQGMYDKWKSEWINRQDGGHTDYVFAGTMWSTEDILNKLTEERILKSNNEVIEGKFKYTQETSDGSTIIIRVPLLDENNVCTCENVMSTEDALFLRETVDDYLFSCVYQQDPIAPSGLEFSYEVLGTYEALPSVSEHAYAVLDPARLGRDNVSMPICKEDSEGNHFMVDVLFQKKSMTELYDDICYKIIDNNVVKLFVENNVDTSLSYVLKSRLNELGYFNCDIVDHFATVKKEQRIVAARGIILRRMFFKAKHTVKKNTDYGRFMDNFTKYSFDYANKHDDAPDSVALYVETIILQKGVVPKAKAIDRGALGF